jgi:hypothetical protein
VLEEKKIGKKRKKKNEKRNKQEEEEINRNQHGLHQRYEVSRIGG